MDEDFDSKAFEKEALEAYEKREERQKRFWFKMLKILLVLAVVFSMIGFAIYRAFVTRFWFF